MIAISADKLKHGFRMGSHHKIERFGVLLLVLTVILTVAIACGTIQNIRREDEAFKTIIGYTSTFESSLSHAKGTVEGIFENEAKTKMFVLLKFDEDSVPNISANVNMYRVLLSGVDEHSYKYTPCLSNPTATLYMLGSSGYMGIMLNESAGFPLQILQLIVRMDRSFVSTDPTKVDTKLDKTFQENDQFALYINPGVDRETVVSADFLDKDTMPTVMDIYSLAASDEAEKELRATLASDLENMELLFTKIKEYEERLAGYSIDVADTPDIIAGDHIDAYFEGKKIEKTARENYVYPEGHPKAGMLIDPSELKRVLVSDTVIPGGYNFDWYEGSVAEGYLNDLRGEKSVAVFLRDNRETKYDQSLAVSDIRWYYTNGVEFRYDSSLGDSTDGAINTAIQELMKAWQEYYTLKIKYERQDLESLLLLERSLTDVETTFSVNTDSTNLWINK